jgi:excisionase family DNA binding protein
MVINRSIADGRPDNDYVTVPEAATLLMVSPSTIWRWIGQGELPAYRFGRRRVRVKRIDLNRMIAPARATHRSRTNGPNHHSVAALDLADPEDIWKGYDPAAVRKALREVAGTLSEAEAEEAIAALYRARAEGSRPETRR